MASGPVWTWKENLAPTEIRSPDRPELNESVYLLKYSNVYVSIHTHTPAHTYIHTYVRTYVCIVPVTYSPR
jgi:hypothetical protein